MSQKKEHTISFRISEDDKRFLEELKQSGHKGKKLSNFLRDALRNYLMMFYVNPQLGNPQMVFSKNLIGKLFSCLSNSEIAEIVDIAYNNALQTFEKVSKIITIESYGNIINDFSKFLKANGNSIYSSKGQNWLDDFTYQIKKNKCIIGASHNLGEQFSLFLKLLLVKHANQFGYLLKSAKFFDKEILKEENNHPNIQNHIALHFVKNSKK